MTNLSSPESFIDNALLQYWQDAALREKFSAFSVDLEHAVSLSASNLKNGMIQRYLSQNKLGSKTVWIAPFKIIKKSSDSHAWVPLWIPADLIERQLHPSTVSPLPWIPTQFFDLQSERGTWFENIEQYDKLLLDYFFDAQAKLVIYSNWETYFSRCLALFQALLRPHVRDLLELDYTIIDDGWMIETLNVLPALSTPLAQQYVSLHPPTFKEYTTDLLCIKGAYPKAPILLPSHEIALMQLLSLKKGEMQALTIPPGTSKEGLLKAFIASIWSEAFEKTRAAPVIVLAGSQKPTLDLSVRDFSQTPEYDDVCQGMQILIEYGALNDTLKKKFESVQRVDNILLEAQLADQKLEIEFERCTQRYTDWQKQHKTSVWGRFATWLPNAKKRREKLAKQFFDELFIDTEVIDQQRSIEQVVLEKIRKIKVTRTKIHNELVEICQWIASKNGMQNRWVSWAQKNTPNRVSMSLEENLVWMRQQCAESLFKKACDYFNTPLLNRMSIEEALDYPFEGMIDYLIIDNAHRITASKILPLLNKAKIAVFLGDEKGFPMPALVSPLYDNFLLKACYVNATEEDLEELAYRGIQTNGSAFAIAKAMSRFKKMQPDGCEAYCELSLQEQTKIHPAIFEYSRSVYLRLVRVLAKADTHNVLPPLCYLHIKGLNQAFELSFRNTIEADFLLDWLVKNTALCTNKSVAIITLFLAQKHYITHRLAALKVSTDVYLLSETDNLSQDIILFSPGYTSSDSKPYLLDQGDAFLNVALTRATESFMIFADMDIFNPHTHSPCGQLAKLLFQKEVSYV